MPGNKQKGPAADKHTDPKRITRKVKRLLDFRQKELNSQASQLLLKFLGEHPEIDTSMATVEALWSFLKFLKESKLCIVSKQEVFCFPLARMVRLSRLSKAGGKDGG